MFEIIIGVLSGLASAAAVSAFFWSIFADLKRAIGRLETDRINKIEQRIEDHLKEDNPAAVSVQLRNLAELVKTGNQLQRHNELMLNDIDKKVAMLIEDKAAQDRWLASLNGNFQDHIRDKELHQHGK